ncbi:hypothetical protein MASR2M78_35800 [Treponema sp.]
MSQSKFQETYANHSAELQRKAPILRAILIVAIIVLPIMAISNFVVNEPIKSALEMILFLFFLVILLILTKGQYKIAAMLLIGSSYFSLFVVSMTFIDADSLLLFRNLAYYIMVIIMAQLLLPKGKLVWILILISASALPFFTFVRLLPAGLPLRDLVNKLVISSIFFGLISFFSKKAGDVSIAINSELEAERAVSLERLKKLSSVVEGAGSNLASMGKLSARVDEIRSLVSDAKNSMTGIEGKVVELETASVGSSEAAERIRERIVGLKNSIEEESSAQIESSASINEMVASIRSVADSATRRRSSMETLAGTADEGMNRLDSLLGLISKIEGSIGSIQSMVSVINSIAGSTNLLSMNAAIEAAHAGDAGRGFAVVAEEIRKLADTSGKNAKEIGRQLKEVISVITKAAEESGQTRNSFSEIRTEIDGAINAFQEITSATSELAEGGRQILEALQTLSEMSLQVKSSGEEIAEAQVTLEELHRSSKAALKALQAEAIIVQEKESAVLVSINEVAQIGEEGIKNAEELHRRSAEAGV